MEPKKIAIFKKEKLALFEIVNNIGHDQDAKIFAQEECQECLKSAKLDYTAVIVWRTKDETFNFFPLSKHTAFLRHLKWNQISDKFTKEIICDY